MYIYHTAYELVIYPENKYKTQLLPKINIHKSNFL